MIGLFDSGLGGLTVVRRVRERFPHADLLFFADQAHVPYGERTPENLLELLHDNIAWLDDQALDAIVMACNTSCAIADVYGWPTSRAPIFDLIESAAMAVERAEVVRIGVIATAATVRTGAYGRRIRSRVRDANVIEIAAPALVPLVEAGKITGDEPRAAVEAVCAALPSDLDAVVLACTHYPVLDAYFAAALGSRVVRIDPALVHAQRVGALIESSERAGTGSIRYVTNGDLEAFASNVALITGESSPAVSYANSALR